MRFYPRKNNQTGTDAAALYLHQNSVNFLQEVFVFLVVWHQLIWQVLSMTQLWRGEEKEEPPTVHIYYEDV